MTKKGGEASTSGGRGGELVSSTPSLKLSKMNYLVWAMNMKVYLDSHDLWQVIVGENQEEDRLALLAIFSAILKEMMTVLDAKKTSKEN
ncbi:unnamed protein product [Spirodela intermedia]|uniref:Uncharacterized protein n=1 Tax=Spirodela intermedia TaxID=51605 RepID=A0A7I8IE99_SPIIN|nr:unnamed protein product [Spirodela intermedia]CAA6656116.1 unnamed protein product [Spirodela intermedia]